MFVAEFVFPRDLPATLLYKDVSPLSPKLEQ